MGPGGAGAGAGETQSDSQAPLPQPHCFAHLSLSPSHPWTGSGRLRTSQRRGWALYWAWACPPGLGAGPWGRATALRPSPGSGRLSSVLPTQSCPVKHHSCSRLFLLVSLSELDGKKSLGPFTKLPMR